MGKVIAIANQKGGVGKTTTSVNLSSCVAAKGKKTLLIDMDPQGNATSGVGVDRRNVEKSIYDVLINDATVEETIIKTKYDKLYIIPSNISLAGAEIELVGINERSHKLLKAMESVKNEFDYIFCDCPPSLGLITLNVLTAADSVLIPIQCEYYALEGLSQLTNTIKTVKKSLNPDIEIEGVLMTMFDARTNLSIQVVEEVKKYFGDKTFKSVIPRNIRLSEAPGFGEPIIEYDRSSKGAESYMELADELIERNE